MAEVSEDIMKSRQTWFWRRVTLQAVIAVFSALLFKSVLVTSGLANDWPTAAVQLALIAAITTLVFVYFAMVDSADKMNSFLDHAGEAVDNARFGGP